MLFYIMTVSIVALVVLSFIAYAVATSVITARRGPLVDITEGSDD